MSDQMKNDNKRLWAENARLREELAAAKEQTEEAGKQLGYMAKGIYRGNTISYIYDKMACYGDQVMMAFNALRLLGWKDESNGNKERAVALKSWAESVVKERDEARAKIAAMEKVVQEVVAYMRPTAQRMSSREGLRTVLRAYEDSTLATPSPRPSEGKPCVECGAYGNAKLEEA